jgi:nitrogen fixation NifU-like protein
MRLSDAALGAHSESPMGNTSETTQDLWPEHSLTFLEMAFRTDRQGRPAHPSGIGHNVGTCRDRITLFVMVRNDTIQTIAYELDGCLNTNACVNTVAEIVEGHRVESAWCITPDMVADYLQTLPPDHFHCAELAVGALYKALADYQQNGRKAWQAGYRRRT